MFSGAIHFQPFLLRPRIPASPRPELPPDARGIIRSTPRANVHTNVRENFRRSVRPNVHKEASQRVGPDPLAKVPTDFHKDVRPNVRLHARVIVPAQPRIFFGSAPPILFVLPAQPIAPSDAVRPVRPRHSLPTATNAARKIVSVQRGDSLWKLAKQNLGQRQSLAGTPGRKSRDRRRQPNSRRRAAQSSGSRGDASLQTRSREHCQTDAQSPQRRHTLEPGQSKSRPLLRLALLGRRQSVRERPQPHLRRPGTGRPRWLQPVVDSRRSSTNY